jgi:hypothetical protein
VKLRITSLDGKLRVTDVDTGDDVTGNISRIRMQIEAGSKPQIEVTFSRIDAELDMDIQV